MTSQLFRLVPLLDPQDPRWAGRTCHGVVIVRALDEKTVRAIAARAADEAGERGACAFLDDTLYTVERERFCNYSLAGLSMVLSGSLAGLGWTSGYGAPAAIG